jgi:hypothetical protein
MKLYGQCRFAPCSHTDRDLIRSAQQTLWNHRLYYESYSPACWLNPNEPVPLRLTHDDDETTIGQVTAIATSGQWHVAGFVVDDPTPEVRERVKVGARVSLGAQSLRRYEDTEPNVVRHELVRLEELVVVEPGALAGYVDARITSMHKPKTQTKPQPPVRIIDAPAPVRRSRSRHERDLDELHRRIAAAGDNADVEAIVVGMRLEKTGRWRLAV